MAGHGGAFEIVERAAIGLADRRPGRRDDDCFPRLVLSARWAFVHAAVGRVSRGALGAVTNGDARPGIHPGQGATVHAVPARPRSLFRRTPRTLALAPRCPGASMVMVAAQRRGAPRRETLAA